MADPVKQHISLCCGNKTFLFIFYCRDRTVELPYEALLSVMSSIVTVYIVAFEPLFPEVTCHSVLTR